MRCVFLWAGSRGDGPQVLCMGSAFDSGGDRSVASPGRDAHYGGMGISALAESLTMPAVLGTGLMTDGLVTLDPGTVATRRDAE
jgi:hypothetical protein